MQQPPLTEVAKGLFSDRFDGYTAVRFGKWPSRFISAAYLCTSPGDTLWVQKRYKNIGPRAAKTCAVTLMGLKGASDGYAAEIWNPISTPLHPFNRLTNETEKILFLQDRGLDVPAILGIDEKRRIAEFEFVEGKNADMLFRDGDYDGGFKIGRVVNDTHCCGLIHEDNKHLNYIIRPNGSVCRIDLELAYFGGSLDEWAHDVEVFLGFLVVPRKRLSEKNEEFIRGFVKGYGDRAVLKRVASSKVLAAFYPFIGKHEIQEIKQLAREF